MAMDSRPYSLRAAVEERRRLVERADAVLADAARHIESLIPPSLRTWAEEHSFVESKSSAFSSWKLSEWLEALAEKARKDGAIGKNVDYYTEDEIAAYGFKNLSDAQVAFEELKAAWAGLVAVDVRFDGEYLYVTFGAAEYAE
jgi:hypothetical protein